MDSKDFFQAFFTLRYLVISWLGIGNTVDLGYNDDGYNEFTAMTKKFNSTFMVPKVFVLHKRSRLQRCQSYNEHIFIVH